jgi:hypothetical protein
MSEEILTKIEKAAGHLRNFPIFTVRKLASLRVRDSSLPVFPESPAGMRIALGALTEPQKREREVASGENCHDQ